VLLSMTERYWTAVVLWSLIWGLVILFQKHQQPLAEDHPKPPAGPGTNRGLRALVVGHTPWYFPRRRSHRADGNAALVYGVIGALILLAAAAFSLTSLGRAEHHLSRKKPA